MAKKSKSGLNMVEKSDKGKDKNQNQRGQIVEVGTPLWQQNGRKRHIQFRAGKMYVIDNMVHPDPRKGYICIEQDSEHVMHFCWMERDAIGTKEDDLTPEPYDSIFKRVTKCTTGRVYVLKIRSTNKNHFFWLQEPAVEKDSETCAKVNYLLNFPPPWMRFPHIAVIAISSSSETSVYDSADESNMNEQPVESTEAYNMNNIETSQTFYEILDSELPGLLQPHKTTTASGSETSHDVPPQGWLGLMSQDVSDITPDSIRSILDNADLMERLEDLLPILEDGEKGSLENSIKSKSFEAETRALTDAVRNGSLEQMLRNSGLSESADAALLPLDSGVDSSDDSDSEYGEAEDLTNWVSRRTYYYPKKGPDHGQPDPSRNHESEPHNINELAAALALNIKENLICGITEESSGNVHQQNETNERAQQCGQIDIALPTGSKVSYDRSCKSTADKGSTAEPNIQLKECGNEHYSLMENWEPSTDPKFNLGHNELEAGNNTQTADNLIDERMVARENTQSSYEKPSGLDNVGLSLDVDLAAPTSSNGNYDRDCKSTDNTGRNIHLNEQESEKLSRENWASAIKPNLYNNRGTDNNTEDPVIDERVVGTDSRCSSTRPLTQSSNDNPSGVDKEESLYVDISVNTGSNGNHDRGRSPSTDDRESTEPSLHFNPSLENWKLAIQPNFHLAYSEHKTGNNSRTENDAMHEKPVPTGKSFLTARSSMRAETSFNENTSMVDNTELAPETQEQSANLATHVAKGKEGTLKTCSEMEAPTNITDAEENIEVTQTTQSSKISRSGSQPLPKLLLTCSTDASHKNTSSTVSEGSPQGQDHACPKLMSLQMAIGEEGTLKTCSDMEDPTNTEVARSGSQASSKLAFSRGSSHKNTSSVVSGGSAHEDEMPEHINANNIVSYQAVMGEEGIFKAHSEMGDSTNMTDTEGEIEVGQPIESTDATRSRNQSSNFQFKKAGKTPHAPNGSGSRGVDVGCGTRLGGDDDGDDLTKKEIPDLSNPGTSNLEDKNGVTAENQQIANENTDISDGEVLDEKNDTSLDDKSSTNTIAMIVLAPSASGKTINANGKRSNMNVRSSVNESPQGSRQSGSQQTNMETMSGSALSPIDGTANSSGNGLEVQKSVKPYSNLLDGQKASNSAVTGAKHSMGKKPVAPIITASKSLEDVIYVKGPDREVRYNLRKRPLPRVETSLNGPIMNAGFNGSGKRLRTSSPGVPLPSPFRVPDASPVRSNRSRYPLASGSPYLGTPNEGGMDQNSRKRPNDEVDSSDSDEEAPPIKKARISDRNNLSRSKAGPSRQLEGPSPASGIKRPASGSRGSGSTPSRSLTLNRTSCGPIASSNPSKGSPQSANSSPRYNVRKRSDPAKIEDEQQTEPVRIREIRNTGPETRVRARTNLQSAISREPPVDRTNRDQSQNTRPVRIEDKKGSKSKPQDRKPSQSDKNPKP